MRLPRGGLGFLSDSKCWAHNCCAHCLSAQQIVVVIFTLLLTRMWFTFSLVSCSPTGHGDMSFATENKSIYEIPNSSTAGRGSSVMLLLFFIPVLRTGVRIWGPVASLCCGIGAGRSGAVFPLEWRGGWIRAAGLVWVWRGGQLPAHVDNTPKWRAIDLGLLWKVVQRRIRAAFPLQQP